MSSKMPYAYGYEQLEVYKYALNLARLVYTASLAFPKEERYSLTDQIRRSSRSIGAQIAEAWGKRPYKKHFVSKLTDSYAELYETQHWIEIAFQCNYLTNQEKQRMRSECDSIRRMLGGMISKATHFCADE